MKILMAAAVTLLPMGVMAQDFEKGLAAARSGDYATALQELRPLAEQGDATAQYTLGWMYRNGNGVLQDYAFAMRWYRLAAEQGYAAAQSNLGTMYLVGEADTVDDVTAHMWINISAVNGDEIGERKRDVITPLMTQDQLAEAQRRARVCMASNYQDCD